MGTEPRPSFAYCPWLFSGHDTRDCVTRRDETIYHLSLYHKEKACSFLMEKMTLNPEGQGFERRSVRVKSGTWTSPASGSVPPNKGDPEAQGKMPCSTQGSKCTVTSGNTVSLEAAGVGSGPQSQRSASSPRGRRLKNKV